MRVVNRINLPKSADVSSLYVRCNEGATIRHNTDDPEIVCHQGGKISSNSYFNSFYESFYAKYTCLDSIYYLLRLEGDFQVSVYREVYEGDDQELIFSKTFSGCQLTEYVTVLLPRLQQSDTTQGRIYFELECLSEQGIFKEGVIATEQQRTQEVSLAIITCTFKKEKYIKNTVAQILQDKFLQLKQLKVIVVDNGKTLSEVDFDDPRVQLISQRNVGGSGGFAKGLVTALETNTYTHLVFMDDDIELDSEAIYRLFGLYEYVDSDFAIAGSMIDLAKKHTLFEAGLSIYKNPTTKEFQPFSIIHLKHNLDLQNSAELNHLLVDEDIDFGGFYFFVFSKKVVEQVGLLLPFFIKGEVRDFGLRIKQALGGKLVAFPSIAVWHEPFFNKSSLWDYYYYRNDLINHAIHEKLKYKDAIAHFTKPLVFSLLLFDYNHAEMLIKAFEDYIQGPKLLKDNDPEVMHASIVQLNNSHKTQKIQHNYLSPHKQTHQQLKASKLKKVASLLTLNGHLLPGFLTGNDEELLWQTSNHAGQRSRALAKRRVAIFKEGSDCLFQNEIDKSAGIKIMTKWLQVVASSRIRWSAVSREWRNASSELISLKFWQQYLEVKN